MPTTELLCIYGRDRRLLAPPPSPARCERHNCFTERRGGEEADLSSDDILGNLIDYKNAPRKMCLLFPIESASSLFPGDISTLTRKNLREER